MYKKILIISGLITLTGCAANDNEDLANWVKQQESSAAGKIEPLPEIKANVVVNFEATQNPYIMKEVASLAKLAKNKYSPNLERRKEPLENYNLENLKMIGFIKKDNKPHAIIKTKDGLVHYVQVGNYIGTDFGMITEITEGAISLDERIKEDEEWKKRVAVVLLDESGKKQ